MAAAFGAGRMILVCVHLVHPKGKELCLAFWPIPARVVVGDWSFYSYQAGRGMLCASDFEGDPNWNRCLGKSGTASLCECSVANPPSEVRYVRGMRTD